MDADVAGFHVNIADMDVNVVRKWLRTECFSEDEFHKSLTSPALPKA